MADIDRFNFHKHLKPVRLALAGILALMLVVVTGIHSYAAMPEAAIIAGKYGSDLFVGTGTQGERIAAELNNKLRGNSILYVPGGNRGWANLGFIFDWPLDSADLLVQAGPHNVASQWSFPCTASGGFRIAWKRGSDRGCEEGVRVTRSGARSQGQIDPNGESILGAKGILKAQGGSEEVIVAPPSSDSSIIQAYESANGIEVETIQGNILVKSAKYPQGRLIPEGQRYSYPQDSTMPIDRNAIANSREMQDFLNPNNWSSPDLPPRVAEGIGQQLGEMRTALGQGSPVASSGTSNQDRNNCSISGRWMGYIDGQINPSASPIMEIAQNGRNLLIGRNKPVSATLVDNRIEFVEPQMRAPQMRAYIVSNDCNEINAGTWSDTQLSFVFKRHTVPYCPLTGQWQYTQYQPVTISIGDPNYERLRFSQPILNQNIQVNEDASGNVTYSGIPNFPGTAKSVREETTGLGYIEPLDLGNIFLNGVVQVDESTIEGYVFEGQPGRNAINKGSYRMTRQTPCP